MREKESSGRRGRIFVVSAPSGCGKTVLTRMLVSSVPGLWKSVSMTTRRPRAREKAGSDYIFTDAGHFRKLVRRKAFLEWARVFGNYYGTPLGPVAERLRKGRDVVLAIDVRGARKVVKRCPDAVTVFLLPPGEQELKRRLRRRATEADSEVNKRLREARRELRSSTAYRYRVINDSLRDAFTELKRIVEKERLLGEVK